MVQGETQFLESVLSIFLYTTNNEHVLNIDFPNTLHKDVLRDGNVQICTFNALLSLEFIFQNIMPNYKVSSV